MFREEKFTVVNLLLICLLAMQVVLAPIPMSNKGVASAATSVDWWPTFQHDLFHSGYSSSSAPNSAALIWHADYNEIRYGSLSGAITCNGVVFATDTTFVVALNETDGGLLWRHDMTGYGSIDGTPSTDGTLIYVVSSGNNGGSGSLHALSCSDGHEVWGQNIGGWNGYFFSPAISQLHSLVVVGSQGASNGPLVAGHVWAFNKNTGGLVWQYDVPYGEFSTSAAIDETSGKIFIVNENSNPMAALYSIDLASGNYLNAYYFTHSGGTGTPTVCNGKVYVESGSGAYYLYCFDENLGFKWNTRLYGGFASLGGLAAAYGRVFTGGDCVDASNGSVYWDHAGSAYTITASPSVADGKMFLEDTNGYRCYNATTGVLIWSYTAYSTAYGTPAISDGKVVFTSDNQAGLYVFGTYDVTIAAHCNAEGKDVRVSATMDGSSSQNTPCTFAGLTGAHNFTVPSTDANGDLFLQWSTGQTTTTITVSAPGTYTAYYAGYSVTIKAHDDTEGVDVNVAIDEDHSPTGFTTPHTFSGLAGTHIFSVAGTDSDNHSFKQWSNGVIINGISVSTPGGTYTAYYSAVPARIEYVQPDELNGFMMLTWSNPLLGSYPDTSVTSFKIYKGVNTNNPTYLTTVDWSQLYYNDYDVSGTLNNFNTYYYWVTGVNSYGEGPMPISGSRVYNGISSGSFCPITAYSNPPQGGCLQWDSGRMFKSGQTVGAYNGGGLPMPFAMMFQTACPGYSFVLGSWQATGAISIDGKTTPNVCYITSLTGSATLTGTFALAVPPPNYNVTISAHDNTGGTDVSVLITMDGASTGYSTPHVFSGLSGSHDFTVPGTDPSGNPFKEWNAGAGRTITVSTGGTYVAYYEAPPPSIDVTIIAHCNAEGKDIRIPITEDGLPTFYNTPYTFTGFVGIHTFTVPIVDSNGDEFRQWSTGENTRTIRVSARGTYTAYYDGSVIVLSNITCPQSSVYPGKNIQVQITAKNTGTIPATRKVQLTLSSRPVEYASMTLQPGEIQQLNAIISTKGLPAGTYSITATNDQLHISPVINVLGKPYFIIVAGKCLAHSLDSGSDPTYLGTLDDCNEAYKTLTDKLHTDKSQICYLASDAQYDKDGNLITVSGRSSSSMDLYWAIEYWAGDLVSNHNPLFIYLHSHGKADEFSMNVVGDTGACDFLSSGNLATYLSQLKAARNPKIYVIIDACDSGSFINDLAHVADATVCSSVHDRDTHTEGYGFLGMHLHSCFALNFWPAIGEGKSVLEAYLAGSLNPGVRWSYPVFDDIQSGNEFFGLPSIYSSRVPGPNGEGNSLSEVYMGSCDWSYPCVATTIATQYYAWPPPSSVPLWAVIKNNTDLSTVYVSMIPPDFVPENETLNLESFQIIDVNGDGNFSVQIPSVNFTNHASGPSTFSFILTPRQGDGMSGYTRMINVVFTQDGQPSPDNIPPSVSVTRPLNLDSVAGAVDINGTIQDDVCLQKADLYIDGNFSQRLNFSASSCSYFQFSLDSTTLTNGYHNVTVMTYDTSGNQSNDTVGIWVVNNVHDVWIPDLDEQKTVSGQGSLVPCNVTVVNKGSYSETINVTLYVNSTLVQTITIVNLSSNGITTTQFVWNTTEFAKGNYTISAYACPVLGETDTSDNMLADGMVAVTIPGDLNGNFIVDIYDAIILANAYNSHSISPNWSPNADINGNGIVDIYDAIILANHFNQHYP
jgi:hypothetical protein